jgi:hypothetical protein
MLGVCVWMEGGRDLCGDTACVWLLLLCRLSARPHTVGRSQQGDGNVVAVWDTESAHNEKTGTLGRDNLSNTWVALDNLSNTWVALGLNREFSYSSRLCPAEHRIIFLSFPSFLFLFLHLLPVWSRGQSSRLQIQWSRVRFPALSDFMISSGSGTGSTQPREYSWGATWMEKQRLWV